MVTILLICFYSIRNSNAWKQKVKKSAGVFGVRRSLCVELLPAMAVILTLLQSFQFFLYGYGRKGSSTHAWLYLSSQSLAWVLSCWILHYQYEAVMANYSVLRIWWFLRSFFHILFLHTTIILTKVVWSPDFVEELLLFTISLIFGSLVLFKGWKLSKFLDARHGGLATLTDSLLQIELQDDVELHSRGYSIWELLLFTWVTPLMDLGTNRQLEYDDLFTLPRDMDPKVCCKWLWKTWADEQKHEGGKSFLRAIYHAYRWPYLGIGILKILNDTLGFAGPLLLNAIVENMQDGSEKSLHFGYWCALSMGVVSGLRAFLGTQYTFLVSKLKLQLRASIITLVYRKALCVSLSERSCFSNGEIQTLMSVDAERTVNLCASLHELWSLPLQMAAALSLLYMQVKFAFFAGLAVILLLIPVNKWIATRISTASQLMMKAKDERVRKMGEVLTYIRTIKMYTWEHVFSKRVMGSRNEEVKYLGVRKYLDAWCVYFWATTPTLFSLFTFGLYSLLGYKVDAAIVFTSLALFNMLISPLNSFPWVVNGLIEASVSLGRLCRFLSCPEIHSEWTLEKGTEDNLANDPVQAEELNAYSLCVQNADFAWYGGKPEKLVPVLSDIMLSVSQGSLVVVLGEVGSGKSSLLQALLGEMIKMQGNIFWQGCFGYVSQIPWIQSGTIRDNILFGKPYHKERYTSVLSACALDVDIERMAGNDLCMVGEHGFNLSGGQRARLALARAIYQDCDILLLDDPLSSVDAHVASWLLEHAIRGPLISNRTVILATYNAQALALADTVILLEGGNIRWSGNISDFNSYFAQEGTRDLVVRRELIDHYISSNSKLKVASPKDVTSEHEGIESTYEKGEIALSFQETPIPLVEEEARVQGTVRAKVYGIYAAFIGGPVLAIILISTSLMQIARNGNDIWLSVWVDKTSLDGINHHSTYFYLEVLLFFAVANSSFTLARAFSFAYGGLEAAFKVHEALLSQIIYAPVYFFDQNPKGRILNRFSSDQYAIDDSLPFIANILLANFFSLMGIVIVLCFVQWTFLIILVPLSYIYISLQKYYRSTSRELRRLDSTSRSPVYSSFTEALDGAPTIRAFKSQHVFSAKNEDHVALNQRTSYSEIAASLWLSIRLQLLAACIIFFISIMAFAGRQVGSPVNSATAGLVGLALSYATPIISLLSDLLSTFTETEKEMVSVERIQEYMEIQGEQDSKEVEGKIDWPTRGFIQFNQVSLVYRPMLPPALKNMSFVIQGGLQVGIAGRTGSGKSSILNVLFRLTQPTSGHIFIDGIDTAMVTLFQLRSKLAIVPQTPFLFEGTIRDNLDPTGNVTDLKIWEILEICHLREVVMIGGGLDMQVMESGESFSLGQRQLICLARSLLQHAKVLCLDECTANVDPQTASILQKTVKLECKGMTVITIAHRISSILDHDRVLILEHGEVVEEGIPQVLLNDPTSKFFSFAKVSNE